MTWNWWEYFVLASGLFATPTNGLAAGSTSDEACFRACISRAYYASFHRAWNELSGKFNISELSTGGSHERVIEALRQHVNSDSAKQSEIRTVGDELADLKKLRKRADYWPVLNNPQGDAVLALTLAKTIESRLMTL